MKPYLLLDVDGTLSLQDPSVDTDKAKFKVRGEKVKLHYRPDTAAKLQQLSRSFQLVWASMYWRRHAAKHLNGLFGIEAQAIAFPESARHKKPGSPGGDMDPEKLVAIAQFVQDRPFALLDDKIGGDALRFPWRPPHLLVRVDYHVGLTDDEMDALQHFAAKYDPDGDVANA